MISHLSPTCLPVSSGCSECLYVFSCLQLMRSVGRFLGWNYSGSGFLTPAPFRLCWLMVDGLIRWTLQTLCVVCHVCVFFLLLGGAVSGVCGVCCRVGAMFLRRTLVWLWVLPSRCLGALVGLLSLLGWLPTCGLSLGWRVRSARSVCHIFGLRDCPLVLCGPRN